MTPTTILRTNAGVYWLFGLTGVRMSGVSVEIKRVFNGYSVHGAHCVGMTDFYLHAAVQLRQWVYLY